MVGKLTVFIAAIAIIAAQTNPTRDDLKEALEKVIHEKSQSQQNAGFLELLRPLISQMTIEIVMNSTTRNNFVFFSVYETSLEPDGFIVTGDKMRVTFLGIFGNIFRLDGRISNTREEPIQPRTGYLIMDGSGISDSDNPRNRIELGDYNDLEVSSRKLPGYSFERNQIFEGDTDYNFVRVSRDGEVVALLTGSDRIYSITLRGNSRHVDGFGVRDSLTNAFSGKARCSYGVNYYCLSQNSSAVRLDISFDADCADPDILFNNETPYNNNLPWEQQPPNVTPLPCMKIESIVLSE